VGGRGVHVSSQKRVPARRFTLLLVHIHTSPAPQFAAWLVDPVKGGADDSITNQFGLSAYDGLGDK
jgi:hypothetical protein